MALLVTFVAIDKSNPPEAKGKKKVTRWRQIKKVTRAAARNTPFFRERKYLAEGKRRENLSLGERQHHSFPNAVGIGYSPRSSELGHAHPAGPSPLTASWYTVISHTMWVNTCFA